MTTAGDLRDRVMIERRFPTAGDGAGNFESEPGPLLEAPIAAVITVLRAGDEVIARRLEGRTVAVVTVRDWRKTRMIRAGDRLTDVRMGVGYAVTGVQPGKTAGFLDLLCESGGPT